MNGNPHSEKDIIPLCEVSALMATALDFNYQFGFDSLLGICNQIQEDTFFDATVNELFNGRPIVFEHKSQHKEIVLTSDDLLKAIMEYREINPISFSEIGASDGYMPQVGTKILLGALFGWAKLATDIGDEFKKYLE